MTRCTSHRHTARWTLRVAMAVLLASGTPTATAGGSPLWTFTALTPTTLTVPVDSTATVRYRVTNQSNRTHVVAPRAIPGVTQVTGAGLCAQPIPLPPNGSCMLELLVTGAGLPPNGVSGGPVLCSVSNPNQCYQPSASSVLQLTPGPPSTATLEAEPASSTFAAGSVAIVTLTHDGGAPVTGIRVEVPDEVPLQVDPDSCADPLPPGGDCQLLLTADEAVPTVVLLVEADNASSVAIEVTVTPSDTLFADGFDAAPGDGGRETHPR